MKDRTEYMKEYMKEYRKKNPESNRSEVHKYWRKRIIEELIKEGKLKDLEENKK